MQEAAVGYLTDEQRTQPLATWGKPALDWATKKLKGAVRALQPIPPAIGTGVAGYQISDYLDQYGRRTRRDQLGPASLWDAFTSLATSASDLTRLADAARDRGLYRHAAALWAAAATLGSTNAGRELIAHLRQVSPADATRAARWAAGQVSLDDPSAIAQLLRELRAAGADDAAHALATRAAGQVSLDDPSAIAQLLRELRAAGADDAAHALATRAAGQVSLDDPSAIAWLLGELRAAGADEAARTLLARDPAGQVSLDDPLAIGALLRDLRAAGADDAAHALATRAAGYASLDNPLAIGALLRDLRAAGVDDAAQPSLARDPAGQVSLDNPSAVASLLSWSFAWPRPTMLSPPCWPATLPATPASTVPGAVTQLLEELRAAGADDAASRPRYPRRRHASLDDLSAIAWLLKELRAPGDDAARTLLARDSAARSASTTCQPSPGCSESCARPGRRRGPRPRHPAVFLRQPRRPGSRRRAAAGLARGRGRRRSHLPCWPATQPARPGSTTGRPSPSYSGSCAGRAGGTGIRARPRRCSADRTCPAAPPASDPRPGWPFELPECSSLAVRQAHGTP